MNWICAAVLAALSTVCTVSVNAEEYKPDYPELPRKLTDETAEQKSERMRWWTEARFGMFIHFGLYSVPAGVGENGSTDLGEWIQSCRQYKPEYKRVGPFYRRCTIYDWWVKR